MIEGGFTGCVYGQSDFRHVDIMPVFLGGGLRPFENLGAKAACITEVPGGGTPGGQNPFEISYSKVERCVAPSNLV